MPPTYAVCFACASENCAITDDCYLITREDGAVIYWEGMQCNDCKSIWTEVFRYQGRPQQAYTDEQD